MGFSIAKFQHLATKKKVATSTKDVCEKNLAKSPYVKEKKLKLHYLDCRSLHLANI
jgi:hypothetical protein